jgi:DNA mismatch endonuclease (patch repair protein)
MMARVRNKDSRAELELRRALHARGIRFRLHAADVLGRPDIVIRKYRFAIFVDGDFWHGNAWRLRGLPNLEAQFPNRTEWWTTKIRRTMARDREVSEALASDGWRVVRLWENEILADPAAAANTVVDALRMARKSN